MSGRGPSGRSLLSELPVAHDRRPNQRSDDEPQAEARNREAQANEDAGPGPDANGCQARADGTDRATRLDHLGGAGTLIQPGDVHERHRVSGRVGVLAAGLEHRVR
jgi:hypothetical protein